MIDSFTKHVWTQELKSKKAAEVAATLTTLFNENGPWECLHSDNGGEFTAEIVSELCEKTQTKIVHGAPYHPQSQGAIERFNQTIKVNHLRQRKYTIKFDMMQLERSLQFFGVENESLH